MNTSNENQRIYLKDYTAPAYSISQIHLNFKLHETKTIVTSVMSIRKISEAPLVLNGENLKLVSLKLNQKDLASSEFAVTNETLTLEKTPTEFTLEIKVEINPLENKSCEGLYLSKGIFATQCEAEGFRHITYFLDRPDVMTTYTVEIEVDKTKYPILLSNGDLVKKENLDSNQHKATWKDPFKKPSYLFALVAGDLGVIEDHFMTQSGKNVKLEVYASHGKQERCRFAMESLKKSMKWDEERFGLEYDLNQFMIVSIDDFNMGAMENKGLNIFNSRLVLADPQSATDTDFDRIESVVGHEYFHNWTGNRVTCRNWFELSLKEGLTVFRDQEFSSDLNSRAVQRIKDVDALRTSQFAEDAGPNSHPVRPESCLSVDNFYTPTIYEKGSEVIRMMQTIVGKKGFRKGMDEYFKRHDGQAVTILDFANAISEPNSISFEQFKLWYSQAGTPTVDVHESYDLTNKKYTLTLTQSCPLTEKQPTKKPFHIPLLIGLIDSKGHDMAIHSSDVIVNSDNKPVLHLTQTTQTFVFNEVFEKPVLSLNRDFSAPIKLSWNASQKELLHLIKYDSDAFNRREASYKMTLQELQRLIQAAQNKKQLQADSEIIEALGYILKDSAIDPLFKALMLQLPNEEILAQEQLLVDAVNFSKAYQCIYTAFVNKFSENILELYEKHHRLDSKADRALKNRLLSILNEGQHSLSVLLATKQYQNAKNMTDKLAAMSVLCQTDSSEKTTVLEDFFQTWKDDAVVFNKWLQVQANSDQPDTFKQVKKLAETAPFSFNNPNNIYSLLCVFGDNYLGMQNSTGETFKWFCDRILEIDQKNPQVAARVSGSFNFVKKFPEPYKSLAQTEIQRVLNHATLSKNVRELLQGCV